MTMTKSAFMASMAEQLDIPKSAVAAFMGALTDLAVQEIKNEGQFKIPGLVQIDLKKRKARVGRNPATGAEVKIPAKTVLKARVPKPLKDLVL